MIVYGGNYLGGYVPQMDNVPNETRSGVWGVAAGQSESTASLPLLLLLLRLRLY
mgnify:CR=1 FL=1